MRPISDVIPKELLPLGTRPAIHLVLEEVAGAGLEEAVVVLSPKKGLVREYLEQSHGLPPLRLRFVDQREPRGLADAVSLCRPLTGDEPFALLLPDNVLISPGQALREMIALFERTARDVIGVVEVDSRYSEHFGNCGLFDHEIVEPRVLRITRLRDKQPGTLQIAKGHSVRRTCGRYVCHPQLFDYIERVRPVTGGELDEVPAYQRIVAEKGALGYLLPTPVFDVGNPLGYLAACALLYRQRRPR